MGKTCKSVAFPLSQMETAHIQIYGIICSEHDKKELAKEYGHSALISQKDVAEQISKAQNATHQKYHIRSEGGGVEEGYGIYDLIRAEAKKGKSVETIGEGVVKSIATVIFLAGDQREITENTEPFFHLPLLPITSGNARQLEAQAEGLRKLEAKAAGTYSERMGISHEEAIQLMEREEGISEERAIEMGFATRKAQPLKAVALYTEDKNKNQDKMNPEAQEEIKKGFTGIMAYLKEQFGSKPQALQVTDANGVEIVFPDVEDRDPQVGDKATIDGASAEGDYVMTDGSTFKFEGGQLSEIVPASPDEDKEMDALKEENEQLKTQVAEASAKAQALEEEKKAQATAIEEVNARMEVIKTTMISAGIKMEDREPEIPSDKPADPPKNRTSGLKKFI